MRAVRSIARRTVAGAGLALVLAAGSDLRAQDLERSVAAGLAIPTANLGASRGVGPLLRGSVTLGDAQRRVVRLRLDLEGSWLQGDSLASSGSWRGGTMAALSGFASMLVGERAGASNRAKYFVLGLGVQRLAIAEVPNPYGTTFAGRIGAGVHFRAGDRKMYAEVVPTVSATDFGTSTSSGVGTVIPVIIGIRF